MASFGEQLKRERERQDMKLEDVSLATKIGTRFLRALEEEHLDQLPGGVFNKGFIRAYARHLGLDENEIVNEYLASVEDRTSAAISPVSALKDIEPAKAQPHRQAVPVLPEIHSAADEPRHHADLIPWGKLAMALLVVAFGFALWGSFSRQPWEPHTRRAEAAPARPAASGTPETLTQAPVPANPAGDPSTVAANTEPPSASTSDSAPSPSSAPASRPAGNLQMASATPGPGASGPFTVLIEAREDSWVQITADGKEIMQDVLIAPRQKTIAASKEVVVKAGNVGGLEFSFNGKRLPAQGDPDEVKTLTFGAEGLQPPRKPLEAQSGKPQA